jgi:hypothetical protein
VGHWFTKVAQDGDVDHVTATYVPPTKLPLSAGSYGALSAGRRRWGTHNMQSGTTSTTATGGQLHLAV